MEYVRDTLQLFRRHYPSKIMTSQQQQKNALFSGPPSVDCFELFHRFIHLIRRCWFDLSRFRRIVFDVHSAQFYEWLFAPVSNLRHKGFASPTTKCTMLKIVVWDQVNSSDPIGCTSHTKPSVNILGDVMHVGSLGQSCSYFESAYPFSVCFLLTSDQYSTDHWYFGGENKSVANRCFKLLGWITIKYLKVIAENNEKCNMCYIYNQKKCRTIRLICHCNDQNSSLRNEQILSEHSDEDGTKARTGITLHISQAYFSNVIRIEKL